MVDNGSSDGSADAVAAAYPEAHLVQSPVNTGAAGGRNLGARCADERFAYAYLLFLDDDVLVHERLADERWWRSARRKGRGGHAEGVSHRLRKHHRLGRRDASPTRARFDYRHRRGRQRLGQFGRSGTVDSCVGFTMAARREAFHRCGGFDEAYNPYGWEEVDLSLRMREAGYTIRYAPAALCWHAGGTPGRGARVAEYERGKVANYLRLMRRHATPAQWLTFLMILPFRALRLIGMHVET